MLIPLAKKVIIDPAKSSAQFSTPVKVVSSHEDFGSVHSLDAVDSSSSKWLKVTILRTAGSCWDAEMEVDYGSLYI